MYCPLAAKGFTERTLLRFNGSPSKRTGDLICGLLVDELTRREVKLSVGGSVRDPVGRLLFNVLAMVAEFETDLTRARRRDRMRVAKAKGRQRGKRPTFSKKQEAHLISVHRAGRHPTVRTCRTLRGSEFNRLPRHQTCRRRRMTAYCEFPYRSSTDPAPPRSVFFISVVPVISLAR